MYDITNKSSFENVSDWMAVVNKQFADQRVKPFYGLIGNKGMVCNKYVTIYACSGPGTHANREARRTRRLCQGASDGQA